MKHVLSYLLEGHPDSLFRPGGKLLFQLRIFS